MKNKIINVLVIILFIILSMILIFQEGLDDLDELWQYNFANNIKNGLVPYRDFNIITTPFFSILGAIFLKLFSSQLITLRIFNTLVFAMILYLAYKIFKQLKINNSISFIFVLIIYFLFYYDVGVEYNYLILLITLISLYWELYNNEKHGILNTKNNFWLGLLVGLTVVTKHTIGAIISFAFIFYKVIFIKGKEDFIILRKIILHRLLGVIIPFTIFLIYLVFNNALYDFINYCVLGIGEFTNTSAYWKLFFYENLLIEVFAFIVPVVLLSFIGLLKFRNKVQTQPILVILIYGLTMLIAVFPIANPGHFIIYGFIGSIVTLYYIYLILSKAIKKKKIISKLLPVLVILLLIAYIAFNIIKLIKLYNNSYVCKEEFKHYYGTIIMEEYRNLISKTNEFIIENKEAGKKVYILDAIAPLFMIPLDTYNKNYDMFNSGNFGKDGEEKLIKEIEESTNTIYLVVGKEYNINWQAPHDIIDYVRENKTKTGEIEIFEIYE